MSLIKRIVLGIGVIILGIFSWIGPKEYFVGFMVVLMGILISLNVKNTWDNKALCYGLGMCSLIGGILKFLSVFPSPIIVSPIISQISSFVGGAVFTIFGIYLIFRGLSEKKGSGPHI